MVAPRDLDGIAADLLRGVANDDTVEAVYEARCILQEDFDRGWYLTTAAVDRADTDAQIEFVAAAVLEPLIQAFPERAASAAIDKAQLDPKYIRALTVVRLTGVPRIVWTRINDALASWGVPAKQLVDWSTIAPLLPDKDGQ